MPANSWWQRLDAERWVYRIGMVSTALLALATLAVLVLGLGQGAAWVALLPAALAAFSGWITAAWRRGRPWSWWVWIVLAGTGTPAAVADAVVEPSIGNAVGLAINLTVLALLCHPRSRARIHGPVAALPTPAESMVSARR